MSKAVMISIKPKWCELIASGRKTIEVRKTIPKIPIPFKCYIYHTVTRNAGVGFNHWCDCWQLPNGDFVNAGGKVVGEFVCDKIDTYVFGDMDIPMPAFDGDSTCWEFDDGYYITNGQLEQTCLTYEELCDYGKGKTLFGWHISNLAIYDTPRELGEFSVHCKEWDKVDHLPEELECRCCRYCQKEYDDYEPGIAVYNPICYGSKPLTRPPQSWCYVEEV